MLSTLFIHLWRLALLFLFILLCFGIGRKVLKRIDFSAKGGPASGWESFLEEFLFTFAIGSVIFAIFIYLIGLFGWINEFTLQVIFFIGLIWVIPQIRYLYYGALKYFHQIKFKTQFFLKNGNFWLIILLILALIFVIINLIGALTPEHIGDGLYYHLGELISYLKQGRITRLFEPEQFKWISIMSKLTEMLYLVGISVGQDVLAKLIHFSFGILLAMAVYIFSRRFFDLRTAIFVSILIYVNPIVSWLSRTAYIDLATAFFSFMAFYALFVWFIKQRRFWLILGAILIGAAIGTKWLALIILFPAGFLIIFSWIYHRQKFKKIIIEFLMFISLIILVTLPWTLFALYHTKNPIYPLLGLKMLPHEWINWGRYEILKIAPPVSYSEYLTQKIWRLWPLIIYQFGFLLQPIIGIFLLIWFYWKEIDIKFKLILLFGIVYFFSWTLIPIQEPRYYYPVMTILIIPAGWLWLKNFSISRILLIFSFIFVILILLRTIDNSWQENRKYIPFVIGRQTAREFLIKEEVQNWLVPKYFYFHKGEILP